MILGYVTRHEGLLPRGSQEVNMPAIIQLIERWNIEYTMENMSDTQADQVVSIT